MIESEHDNPFRNVKLGDWKVFMETKEWDFYQIQKKYKEFKEVRFNDIMMTFLSIAFNWTLKQYGSKSEHLICALPVNMRNPPRDIDDVVLTNVLSSCKVSFPIL